jgi:hypothetical protein
VVGGIVLAVRLSYASNREKKICVGGGAPAVVVALAVAVSRDRNWVAGFDLADRNWYSYLVGIPVPISALYDNRTVTRKESHVPNNTRHASCDLCTSGISNTRNHNGTC